MITHHPLTPGQYTFQSEIAGRSADATCIYKQAMGQNLLISLHFPPEYQPEQQKYPLFVMIHGGGWASRRIFENQEDWSGDYMGFLARYYAKKGFLCAGIDYRLLKNAGQIVGFEMSDLIVDCLDAVEYLRVHANELGADLERTAVLGESAGGHLAAMIAVKTDFFKASVLVNPVTDLRDPKWNHLLPFGDDKSAAVYSPIDHIHPATCPALLLHGASDSVVNPDHSRRFHDRMQEAGCRADLHLIDQTNHAFLLADYMYECGRTLDAANIAVGCIDAWLNEIL